MGETVVKIKHNSTYETIYAHMKAFAKGIKEGRKVKVIERDPTYKTASFPLSLGGFRRQFFQKENILLGKFAREFIFQIPELLKTEKNPKPTASMVTNGYLLMFGQEHAEEQYKALENHKACDAGTKKY